MREGFCRLYRHYADERGRSQRRLVARFLFHGNSVHVLEDHDGIMESLVPGGHVDGQALHRLDHLSESPYWELVHEDEVQQGEHEDLLPEVDAGPGNWQAQEE